MTPFNENLRLTVSLYAVMVFLLTEKIERTVQIEASTVEIEERGVKLRLTVVDTPGYGDAINSQDWYEIILRMDADGAFLNINYPISVL